MMSVFSLDKVGLETVSRCPVCASFDHRRLFDANDTLHGLPGVWTVRRCSGCGHGFTSPRPDRTSISMYYPDDYSPFHSTIRSSEGSAAVRALKSAFGTLFNSREFVIPPGAPGVALEVGCGSGRFLVELARRGWSVHGIEPSSTAVSTLGSTYDVPITQGTVETVDFAPSSFDLVAGLMVLEHLHDPLADARKIASWIRPGGIFMGSVPNCASWEFRVFGPRWFALQVPTHLQHFTPCSLSRLLASAGFERPHVVGQRNLSNLMIHLGKALDHRGWPGARLCLEFPVRGPRALRLALWPFAAALAAVGQAGRMTFIARKREASR